MVLKRMNLFPLSLPFYYFSSAQLYLLVCVFTKRLHFCSALSKSLSKCWISVGQLSAALSPIQTINDLQVEAIPRPLEANRQHVRGRSSTEIVNTTL